MPAFQPARLKPAAAAGCALLALAACRLDYGKNVEAQALERNVPNMVIADSEFRIIRDDVLVMILAVDRAETYAEAGQRTMTGVRFTQYNDDGSVAARGVAGKAVQIIQTDDVKFSEGLTVEIASEGATIRASALDWSSDAKVLRGGLGEAVSITKENGSVINGKGLNADLGGRVIELEGGVDGVIANE